MKIVLIAITPERVLGDHTLKIAALHCLKIPRFIPVLLIINSAMKNNKKLHDFKNYLQDISCSL